MYKNNSRILVPWSSLLDAVHIKYVMLHGKKDFVNAIKITN